MVEMLLGWNGGLYEDGYQMVCLITQNVKKCQDIPEFNQKSSKG